MDPQTAPTTPEAIPPPPPGYVPVPDNANSQPPPPAGYIATTGITAPAATATTSGQPTQQPSAIDELYKRGVLGDADVGLLREAAKTYSGLSDIVGKIFGGSQPTAFNTAAHQFANEPNENIRQSAGGAIENVGEFFTGEELLGLIGKTVKGAEALRGAQQLATITQKYPTIARILRLGMNATRPAAVSAGQTFVKTGGDTGAAVNAGLETGTLGAALSTAGELAPKLKPFLTKQPTPTRTVEGIEIPAPKVEVTPAETAGRQAYAKTAQETVRPRLETLNKTGAIQPPLDIDTTLSGIHDFSRAADVLTKANDQAYNGLDFLTDGRFRKLNGELNDMRTAARAGDPDAVDAGLQAKEKEMEGLFDSLQGKIKPEDLQAIKNSWVQSYILKDAGKMLDGALDGIPGDTTVSQVQRGIKGGVLLTGINRLVNRYGFDKVNAALGPGRLQNLEAIGQATKTAAQRQSFNRGVSEVAKYLPIWAGAHLGEKIAGTPGFLIGGAAGTYSVPAARKVIDAVRANPKIGQSLIYAIQYGARPERYGPLIATMIQQSETEASKERQSENVGENQ